MELFSNKYLYYFTCLVADLIYLIWFVWCMFFPKKLLQKIAIFIVVYIFLTLALTILYFYLGSLYAEDLGLNSKDVAKWSRYDLISIFLGVGAFMAPIAVLLGFDLWKRQLFETSKIKMLGELKNIVSKQREITAKYRLSDNAENLRNREDAVFKANEKKWSDEFENYRWEIMKILETDGFYIGVDSNEIKKLYELNNSTLDIITKLESAAMQLRFCWIGNATIDKQEDEKDQDDNTVILKRIFLISPTNICVKINLDRNPNLKEVFSDYEKEVIYKRLNDFYDYLNILLKEAYL